MKLTADEQIDAIVRLMVTGQWRGGSSKRRLAREWGCHPRTVGDRAVSASAFVRRAGGDLESWIAEKLAELEQVKETAMRLKKPVVVEGVVQLFDAPDTKAAALAIRLQLEARGALIKRTQAVEPTGYEDMTSAEKIAAHEKAIAEERERLTAEKEEVH